MDDGNALTTSLKNGYLKATAAVQELTERAADAEAAVARVRHLSELTIATSIRLGAIEQARDTLAVLDGLGADLVAVRIADLDMVMNHAGDPAAVAEYPPAAERVRQALEGARHD